ncbi:hypothetical protein PFLUV_G00113030 [Perca fluviatilis]|uniref:TNF family profile domain-containing protein n=1 Tax=Perca fluviatilis TaxID=8168 RepID=A0A6A5F6H7_PERFL|nr:hypothetical protein PFLUV_G00113030 [Perca fluviatilis]
MDQRRMDADGGRVLRRGRRTSKLAVVVAVQNVLITACLAVTLYVCWDAQSRPEAPNFVDDVHIQFEPIAGISESGTLPLLQVKSSSMMSLDGDKIKVKCNGPYVFYMEVCYRTDAKEASGTLQLKVMGRESPVSSIHLNDPHEVCRGLQSIAYLRSKEEASLYLSCTGGFKIENATVGLNYMLGTRCEY